MMRPRFYIIYALLLFVARAAAQNGNGNTSGCIQKIGCDTGCTNGLTAYNSGICYQCGPGWLKSYVGSGSCTSCNYLNAGASCVTCTSWDQCTCNAGFYGPNGGTCTACPDNSGASCSGCTSSSQCTCNAGYTGPPGGMCVGPGSGNGITTSCTQTANCGLGCTRGAAASGTCYQCGSGWWKGTSGTALCTACAANSGSACVACTSATQCACNSGHTGPAGGPCTACAAGTYKQATGTATCSSCSAGLYSTTVGATISTTCLACPTGSNSAAMSGILTACICNAGRTGPDGGPCSTCALGKYKSTTGSVTCTDCGSGTFSTTAAATSSSNCLSCPLNSGASCIGCTTMSSCTCNLGYSGPNGGPCAACTAGQYKSLTGSGTCQSCPSNSGDSCAACYTSACECNTGFSGGNFISPYSLTACARFVALILSKPSFSSVSNRANAGIGTLPTYNPTGGPNGTGHVRFDRTLSQFIDCGPRTLNVLTNGGLTIVAIVRFGTLVADERIFEMWSAGGLEFSLGRLSSTTTMTFFGFNAGVDSFARTGPTDSVSTQWTSVICSVVSINGRASIRVNQSSTWLASTLTLPVQDKLITNIYIGKALSPDRYFNGDIAGLFVVDEWLTPAAASAIYEDMLNGVDLTDTTCPSGNACTQCPAGTYKIASGSASCTACPAGTTSPVGSTSSAACVGTVADCNAGYTGPSGGPCVACVAGTYKNTSGSAACTDCGTGTYSAEDGASCVQCPGNSSSPTTSADVRACVCNMGYYSVFF